MHQLLSLSLLFIAWKGLVLTTAWCAPGLGYDTSTTLLPSGSKLVRWDAIYYVHKAQYGEVFEQEWAFGKGLSTVMSTMSSQNLNSTIAAGVLLAHASHFISVLVLWAIANTLRARSRTEESLHQALPFVAACLHILSPAGIFLSAPYAESPFSCLNMLGIWFYLQSHTLGMHYLLATRSGLIVISGICFGLATIIRSNGILSGIPVLLDAVELMWKLISGLAEGHLSWSRLCLLTASVCSGLCVAMGLIVPQYLAHQEYCTATETVRPWCYEKVPMIYSFVQSHYWGVGFLRYWTVSNMPLFALAIPVLSMLIASGIDSLVPFTNSMDMFAPSRTVISRFAAPQLILATLAITNYHIQIITRLSSGYPWLYIWSASQLCNKASYSKVAIGFCVIYSLIQGGLFASFLPPA